MVVGGLASTLTRSSGATASRAHVKVRLTMLILLSIPSTALRRQSKHSNSHDMSFDINWKALTSDGCINDKVKTFLHEQFNSIPLPPFINELSVTDFSMGETPPNITIRHIGEPFDDFYDDTHIDEEDHTDASSSNIDPSLTGDDEDGEQIQHTSYQSRKNSTNIHDGKLFVEDSPLMKVSSHSTANVLDLETHESDVPSGLSKPGALETPGPQNQTTPIDKVNDIQFIVEIDYGGDMMIEISVDLLVNYPSTQFISLPIKLKITDLEIHCLATLAYIQQNVFVSFLCDLNDSISDYFSIPNDQGYDGDVKGRSAASFLHGGNFVDYASTNMKERIDVIRSVKIDTEIGEVENNVLRNVGKVEKFLVEQLRTIFREEVCWPSWICVNLDDDDDDDEKEDEDDDEKDEKDEKSSSVCR